MNIAGAEVETDVRRAYAAADLIRTRSRSASKTVYNYRPLR